MLRPKNGKSAIIITLMAFLHCGNVVMVIKIKNVANVVMVSRKVD